MPENHHCYGRNLRASILGLLAATLLTSASWACDQSNPFKHLNISTHLLEKQRGLYRNSGSKIRKIIDELHEHTAAIRQLLTPPEGFTLATWPEEKLVQAFKEAQGKYRGLETLATKLSEHADETQRRWGDRLLESNRQSVTTATWLREHKGTEKWLRQTEVNSAKPGSRAAPAERRSPQRMIDLKRQQLAKRDQEIRVAGRMKTIWLNLASNLEQIRQEWNTKTPLESEIVMAVHGLGLDDRVFEHYMAVLEEFDAFLEFLSADESEAGPKRERQTEMVSTPAPV